MAEYLLTEDETPEKVAQELLAHAKHPDDVTWQPRSDTPHGGVFVLPDDDADALLARRRAKRAEDSARIQENVDRAAERDAAISDTGLTPAEAGFHANQGTDPGSPVDEDDADQDDEDDDEVHDAATGKAADADQDGDGDADQDDEDKATETRAQARRRVARERAAANQPADDKGRQAEKE